MRYYIAIWSCTVWVVKSDGHVVIYVTRLGNRAESKNKEYSVDPGVKLGPPQISIFSFLTTIFDSYGIHQKRLNRGRNGYVR
jgi:hypothetical protein